MSSGRMPNRSIALPLVFLLFVIFFLTITRHEYEGPIYKGSKKYVSSIGNSTQDREVLQILNLTSKFEYRRHCILAGQSKDAIKQDSVNITQPLLSRPAEIDSERIEDDPGEHSNLPIFEQAIPVQVPSASYDKNVDTGTLILGVATYLDRLNDSLVEMSRWLSNTETHLLVLLRDERDYAATESVQQTARTLAMNVTIIPWSSQYDGEARSNFGLATFLWAHRTPKTQWFGVIDDDTFFVSLPKLLAALTPYDPQLPYYIGGLSERHLGISSEGFKAWGGAGIFISPPLLETIAANSDECLELAQTWGDALWRVCIVKVTTPTVKVTYVPGLNQLDMVGDVSGWYESGPDPLLSLHHWKSWYSYPVHIAHRVTDVAGVESFLQRYVSTDNVVVSNGFSIVHYPTGLPDLKLVEGTMSPFPDRRLAEDIYEFYDTLGKLRPALQEGSEKISWHFAHATEVEDGCVRQFYVRKAGSQQDLERPESERIDSVIEVDWCNR